MDMRYCPVCGSRLMQKEHPTEGPTLYCQRCGDYRFPIFSTAVSAVVLNKARTRMLLIRQYGERDSVLVAGYVDKGETAEEAVIREVREELGMTVCSLSFHRSHYYEPTQTLMLHYSVTVAETEARPNWEVDSWEWVPVGEAKKQVRPGGLAEILLDDFYQAGE